jgi:gamma-glutamyl:cysteine ligase YbdK (ATP-grasp superfamily)
MEMADLGIVDALARLQLAARRSGYEIAVTDAPSDLRELIELAGLADALGVEPRRQPEEREERLGVEEERELPDSAA